MCSVASVGFEELKRIELNGLKANCLIFFFNIPINQSKNFFTI